MTIDIAPSRRAPGEATTETTYWNESPDGSMLHSGAPDGPIQERWEKHKFDMKLVNPANKRRYTVIMVGSGLAGASASASLAELGYNVECFCYQDSPRRAHSIAAQGGINGAKNYRNDGDSVYRLFYDTVKGGDFRSRESNVYRLAEVSVDIIDQCVAQGCSITARSAARRCRAPSTRGGRRASSSWSGRIRRSATRSASAK